MKLCPQKTGGLTSQIQSEGFSESYGVVPSQHRRFNISDVEWYLPRQGTEFFPQKMRGCANVHVQQSSHIELFLQNKKSFLKHRTFASKGYGTVVSTVRICAQIICKLLGRRNVRTFYSAVCTYVENQMCFLIFLSLRSGATDILYSERPKQIRDIQEPDTFWALFVG